MKYTLDTLKKINERFIESHRMKESDVEMANAYVELIERTRSTTEPQSGDLIQYTDEHGNYYSAAHIEKVNGDGTVNVCEKPYIPFINANVNNDGIRCCTSGGPWCDLPVNKLVYVGKGEKHFQDWGNCGGCANGAIVFNANVSVWEYVDERNKFISENGFKFTTKDFDKYYVTFNPDKEKTNYVYFTDGNAWESKMDYQAWLRTYRAEVFKGYRQNQFVVWTWRNMAHLVSPDEYDNLDLPEDTFLMNGDLLKCKRTYNEDTHTIDTYFVWYWNEPGKDFLEVAAEQNRIREERYTLPGKKPEYQIARRELESGEVKYVEAKSYLDD